MGLKHIPFLRIPLVCKFRKFLEFLKCHVKYFSFQYFILLALIATLIFPVFGVYNSLSPGTSYCQLLNLSSVA